MQNETTIPERKINGTFEPVVIHPDPILAHERVSVTGVERFWSKVDKTDGCWIWTGTSDGKKGGTMGRGGAGAGNISTRSMSWLIHYGPLPGGRIRNNCGNSLCIRPDHLAIRDDAVMPPIDWKRAEELRKTAQPTHRYVGQDPTLPEGFSTTFRERFWSSVNKTESCWLWTKTPNSNGYGVIGKGWNQKSNLIQAHIASWIMHNGPIPKDMCVLHNCPGGDNKLCVRPSHLWLGSPKDNTIDAIAKYKTKHGTSWNSKLVKSQVDKIREAHGKGETIGAISRTFGLSRCHVSKIVNNLAHVIAEPERSVPIDFCI